MSSIQPQPATFILPSGIVLPPGAQPDYAVTYVLTFDDNTNPNAFSYETPNSYYDLIVTVSTTLVTSAVVGDRVADLVLFDSNGGRLWSSPAAVAIPASSIGTYTWSSSAPTAYSVMDGTNDYLSFTPVPATVLFPGYSLVVSNRGMGAGDEWVDTAITIIHVPTGPIVDPVDPSLVPTPMLV